MVDLKMSGSFLTGAALVIALAVTGWVGEASATAPIGACCAPGGACSEVLEGMCVNAGGIFLGLGTSCDEAACEITAAAPLLSIGALAATALLLGIAGMWRFRRSS